MKTSDLITVLHSSHKGSREHLWRQEGSEYSAVIISVLNPTLRNAVYTGRTRGKRLLLSVERKKANTLAARNLQKSRDRPSSEVSICLSFIKSRRTSLGTSTMTGASSLSTFKFRRKDSATSADPAITFVILEAMFCTSCDRMALSSSSARLLGTFATCPHCKRICG
jgi:hypothetical protein